MRDKFYGKVVTAAMVAAMSGMIMTGCGSQKAAPESAATEITAEVTEEAQTENIEDDSTATTAEPDKAEEESEDKAENVVNGPEDSVYHDGLGWSIRYDANKFTVTPQNGQVFIVYQGESAGTNCITVSYTLDNGEEAIKALGESWGSDKTTYSEGIFPGTEDVKGYWATLPPSEEGSGLYETAVGRDYLEGSLVFELTGHNCGDEEKDMAVSDDMASIIDSLTFEQ